MANLFGFLFLILFVCSQFQFCISIEESPSTKAVEITEKEKKEIKARNLFHEGNDLYKASSFKEAIQKLEEANSILPTEDNFYLLGLCYLKLDDYKNSKESFQQALEINPKNERVLLAESLLETGQGKEEDSLEILTRLTEFYPEKDIYRFKRAVSLKSLKRYKESLDEFKKINEKEFSQKSQLFTHLGELYLLLKDNSLSEKYFSKAKALNPDLKDIDASKNKLRYDDLIEKGNLYYYKKNYKEAAHYFEEAVFISASASLYFKLGTCYSEWKNFKKGEEYFKKSLSLEKAKSTFVHLANLYLKENLIFESVNILQSATLNYPEDSELFFKLGSAYKKLANPKLAIISFIRAKDLDPNSILTRKNLAFTYLEESQLVEASREFKDLQALSPNESEFKDILNILDVTDGKEDVLEKIKKWKNKRTLSQGRNLEDLKQFDKAEKYYLSKLSDSILRDAAKYRLSLLYSIISEEELSRNRFTKAEIFFNKAKEYDSKSIQIKKIESILRDSKKREIANKSYAKAEKLSNSKENDLAIAEYSSSFFKEKSIEKLNKIINLYLLQNQKEACLSFLKKAERESEDNTDLLEQIAFYYLKLNQITTGIGLYKKILEKNPESYRSYYQLGLNSLEKDRRLSLSYFEKAIAIERHDSNLYIARGINYYKLGNRERAGEDFRYALSLESDLEIASYNLGILLYNDNLIQDAELIFLDLTKKYPNFQEPFYHLSYIYFERKDFSKAEKYILKSLSIDRNAASLYAYIQILKELQNEKDKTKITKSIQSLKKELIDNFPQSSYAKNLSTETIGDRSEKVSIQSYPLEDMIQSQPIYINQSLIVNYGTYITRIHSEKKSILWRIETPSSYRILKANTRLYGLSKSSLDQFDLETGKLLWSIPMRKNAIIRFQISDTILYSEKIAGVETLYSYSMDGEFLSSISIPPKSKWELTITGKLYIFHNNSDGMSWEIYDSKLQPLTESFTLLSAEAEIRIIGTIDDSCYLLRENTIYRFNAKGEFLNSGKLDEKATLYIYKKYIYMKTQKNLYIVSNNLDQFKKMEGVEVNQSEFPIDNNTYLSSDGIIKVRDQSGKILWSENLSKRADKTKSSAYSVYIAE
ncbi:MAG TPA: tetratricopeptide repeat protein [Leptospiraceae bacterium]|nr:tetratricopeptide repeat protein [Leptospiraceae bacterium]HMW03598.1 tetratricopeptide repeat protein [Leptospiraceae bacterium]HMX35205.1 tetratricopeptide repeat protein [Leptospiraceae bacterium]HMY29481.1 tetratricopeptide repeat protein [Leptospiraceae bacterium]HNA10252.1 tetratricopeptide repeat protein [Leptospiraceae bacterium]